MLRLKNKNKSVLAICIYYIHINITNTFNSIVKGDIQLKIILFLFSLFCFVLCCVVFLFFHVKKRKENEMGFWKSIKCYNST